MQISLPPHISTRLTIWNMNCVCPSPLEKTVVLGVTSRSRDGLKGKAHSCDSLARSVRSSSRGRRGCTDLWSPILNTKVQAQPRLHSISWTRKNLSVRNVYLEAQQQADADSFIILQLRKRAKQCITEREMIPNHRLLLLRSIKNKMNICRKKHSIAPEGKFCLIRYIQMCSLWWKKSSDHLVK